MPLASRSHDVLSIFFLRGGPCLDGEEAVVARHGGNDLHALGELRPVRGGGGGVGVGAVAAAGSGGSGGGGGGSGVGEQAGAVGGGAAAEVSAATSPGRPKRTGTGVPSMAAVGRAMSRCLVHKDQRGGLCPVWASQGQCTDNAEVMRMCKNSCCRVAAVARLRQKQAAARQAREAAASFTQSNATAAAAAAAAAAVTAAISLT